MNRRNFLKLMAMAPAGLILPRWYQTPPHTPYEEWADLEAQILNRLEDEQMGFELRRIQLETGRTDFRIMHNAYRRYPVASCFKVLAVFYYLLLIPQDDWETDEDSAAYRVAVYSNNPMTGDLIAAGGEYWPSRGNSIQKFNEFCNLMLLMQNGIRDWDWPGSPTYGENDPTFAPSLERAVRHDGEDHLMDNVFYAADLAEIWARMTLPEPVIGEPQGRAAAEKILELFAIPAEEYESPIERAWGTYIGKDGVIPDTEIGRVTNDAGIVTVNDVQYTVAAMYAGGEYRFVEILRGILEDVEAFEESRA
jgi:hypothetical protein